MTLQPASALPMGSSPQPIDQRNRGPQTNERAHTGGIPNSPRKPASANRGRALLLALVVLGGGGGTAAYYFLPMFNAEQPNLVLHTVRRDRLVQTIVEKGEMQSAENHDMTCKVNHEALANSKTNIKWVIDDGSVVAKGDKLMMLDSSKLVDLMRSQGINRDKAYNDYIGAKSQLEIITKQTTTDVETAIRSADLARGALAKYKDGEYPQLLEDVSSRIYQSEADMEQLKDYAAHTDRMVQKKFMSESQRQAAQSRLLAGQLALQKLRAEKRVLVEFTLAQTTRELQGKYDDARATLDRLKIEAEAKVTQARNDLKTKESVYKQEQAKYDDIKAEIDKCTIYAEQSGMVVYYQSAQSRRGSGGQQSIIAEGEQVYLGQKLLQIPDLQNMLVNAKVHEALVSNVKVGQRVSIKPHAFAGRELMGKIKSVANVAAQQDWFSGDVKVYDVMVEILDPISGLKPGMGAEVVVYTDVRADNVLTVPVQAIQRVTDKSPKFKVFVKKPDRVEEREVKVGISNGKMVEIQEGLTEGEEVVMNLEVITGKPDNSANQRGGNGREGAYPGAAGPGGPGGPPVPGGGPGKPGAGPGAPGGTPGGLPGGRPGAALPGGKPAGLPGTPAAGDKAPPTTPSAGN